MPSSCSTHDAKYTSLSKQMIAVLGHDSALARLHRAGDNLRYWDEMNFVMNHTPGTASIAQPSWSAVQCATIEPRMTPALGKQIVKRIQLTYVCGWLVINPFVPFNWPYGATDRILCMHVEWYCAKDIICLNDAYYSNVVFSFMYASHYVMLTSPQ